MDLSTTTTECQTLRSWQTFVLFSSLANGGSRLEAAGRLLVPKVLRCRSQRSSPTCLVQCPLPRLIHIISSFFVTRFRYSLEYPESMCSMWKMRGFSFPEPVTREGQWPPQIAPYFPHGDYLLCPLQKAQVMREPPTLLGGSDTLLHMPK